MFSRRASMPDAVFDVVLLHYRRPGPEGADSRVVFVHGLVMDNLSSWYFSIAGATASFADVLLYDLRGHGLSERPKEGYGVARMVQDLDGLLALTFGRAPVCLAGNSFDALR